MEFLRSDVFCSNLNPGSVVVDTFNWPVLFNLPGIDLP